MPHIRARIRAAIVAALAATPQLAGRVSSHRLRRTQDADLPVALVYTLEETSQAATLGRTLERRTVVAIEIRARANDALDDVLDGLAVVVERALAADPKFGCLALDCVLDRTQLGLQGDPPTQQHGVALLSFGVRTRTAAGAPDA